MTLLLTFLFVSIFFSFLCSILEAVLLSITPSFIRRQEKQNPKLYLKLRLFKKDIDRPLSAILTLNTIAHTVGAMGVGAQAAILYGTEKWSVLGLNITAEGIIATLMTLAILILSEIIPKTIGANNWERMAAPSIWTLNWMIKILGPLVWLSQFITRSLKKDKLKPVLNRADLLAMTQAGSEDGVLEQSESQLIRNVLNLPNKNIEHIMTPRTVMFTAKENDRVADLIVEDSFEQFTRVPVYDEEKEEVKGMVLKSDVLKAVIAGNSDLRLSEMLRPIGRVEENTALAIFFKNKHKERQHMHIVVDRYGSVTGLVTLEDVLETILGYEIMDETDQIEDMQSLIKKKKEEE
ncbi:MAG: hemolysin family protein [Vicingaceae bacterium]